MKKLALVTLLLLILAACSSELPPTPPPPGQVGHVGGAIAGLASALPTWAANPVNAVVTPTQGYFGDGVIVSASNYDYIYANGYLFNAKTRTWEKFTLQGEQNKDWIKTQAIASVPLDPAKFVEGNNYLVVYACSKSSGSWDCNNNRWMLLTINVLGNAQGAIPELANVDQFVLNNPITPYVVLSTTAEKDNFGDINVIRYDAKYREPKGLVVLTHVFDFNNRGEVDTTMKTMFKDYINNGWQVYSGNNVALFLASDTNHRIAFWSSGKEILYIETFDPGAASKEIIDAYLTKYPSDMQKIP